MITPEEINEATPLLSEEIQAMFDVHIKESFDGYMAKVKCGPESGEFIRSVIKTYERSWVVTWNGFDQTFIFSWPRLSPP